MTILTADSNITGTTTYQQNQIEQRKLRELQNEPRTENA
jgi:hypothetical protein